ncbi:hypothetical protein MMC20_001255, partial [Loxospora ochrophaea]|nr:hypothetical protein [Loxospora ochrophaea]
MAESANAQLVLEPIPSTSAECKGDASSTTLSIQMIQAESSSASPPETSTRSQTHSEKRESSEPLKNIIPMVIRKEGGSITRRGKLDTGSDFDIMSKEVLDALSMGMEDYQGDSIRGFGCKAPVVPLGKTKVEWHVYEKPKTYTTEFLVFSEEQTTDFDILL